MAFSGTCCILQCEIFVIMLNLLSSCFGKQIDGINHEIEVVVNELLR